MKVIEKSVPNNLLTVSEIMLGEVYRLSNGDKPFIIGYINHGFGKCMLYLGSGSIVTCVESHRFIKLEATCTVSEENL